MTDRRILRWATTSARVAVGAGLAVAAVVAVSAAVAAPWPTLESERVALEAIPAPSDTVLACDGALLTLGQVVEQAGEYGVAAAQRVVSGPAASEAVSSELTAPGGSSTAAFAAAPIDRVRTPLAASGSASVESADLRGFSASACHPPLMESWIVGGATTLGTNDLVLLSNPGEVAATVDVAVFGAAGEVTAPGGAARVVPPASQIVIPLAGLISNEESPVLHITATGAPVAASLQSSIIRTLNPGGIDQVAPIAAASGRQVVPGIRVRAEPSASNAATIVRLLAPSADAQAEVTLLGADGSVAVDAVSVPLTAAVPSELELGELEPGRYTAVIEADAQIVTGVWSTTGFGEGDDFAWFSAAPQVSTPSPFAVAPGPSPRLTLANTGADDATAVLESESGESEEVSVAADEVTELEVSAGETYTLRPSAPLSAGVSYAAGDALAGYPVWGADAAAGPITVYP